MYLGPFAFIQLQLLAAALNRDLLNTTYFQTIQLEEIYIINH